MTRHRTFAAIALAATAMPLAFGTRAPPGGRPGAAQPRTLPAHFAADRFFVRPVTVDGDTLSFYTDSGGGLFIFSEAVQRLGLQVDTLVAEGDTTFFAAFPEFRPEVSIPPPLGAGDGRLPVLPTSTRPAHAADWDGLLGQAWFAGRVWTFDYPGRRLLLREGGIVQQVPAEHRAALGFQTDSSGARTNAFPRIRVEIDGDSLDLLFDTGATLTLTDDAWRAFGANGPREVGTSFIADTFFQAWRARHPDWRIVENADALVAGMAAIRVPEVAVAGYRVGPVWFTQRPDPSFHRYMSQWMDRRVEGALGGSALRYYRVTLDYPNAVATFERP